MIASISTSSRSDPTSPTTHVRSCLRRELDGVRRELPGKVGVGAAGDARAVCCVLQRVDLAVLVEAIHQVSTSKGNEGAELNAGVRQLAFDLSKRFRDSFSGLG